MIKLIPTHYNAVKRLRKAPVALIKISYDEWFPYYDIDKLEDYLDAGDRDRVIEVSEDDYAVYKGLLVQMEKLQDKLEKLYKQGSKP